MRVSRRTIAVAAGLVLVGAGADLATSGGTGSRLAAFVPTALADPLSIFDARSPGIRRSAALNQTKLDLARIVPSERVLTRVRERPPFLVPSSPLLPVWDTVLPPGVLTPIPVVFGDIPFGDQPNGFLPVGSPILGGGLVLVPDVPGQPPVNPPVVEPPIVQPPVAPVPEPGTWLAMLTGFAAIGAVLRRRRAAEARAKVAASHV